MYISGKNEIMQYVDGMLHDAFYFLAAGLACAVFGQIYEVFSHEVYSFSMIYAFMIPMVPGALLHLMIVWHAVKKARRLRVKEAASGYKAAADMKETKEAEGIFFPGRFTRHAWNSGIATLTVGCLFQGVLDIYGTTNRLIVVYPIAGALLIGIAAVSYIMSYMVVRKMRRKAGSLTA